MLVLSWLFFPPGLGKALFMFPSSAVLAVQALLSFGIVDCCAALSRGKRPTLTYLCRFPGSTLQVPLSASQLCVLYENTHFNRENSDLDSK